MPIPEYRKHRAGKLKAKSGFLEKLVARLDRVESGEVQQIVSRLLHEKGFLKNVFEALREGVIILDPEGVIMTKGQAFSHDKGTGL